MFSTARRYRSAASRCDEISAAARALWTAERKASRLQPRALVVDRGVDLRPALQRLAKLTRPRVQPATFRLRQGPVDRVAQQLMAEVVQAAHARCVEDVLVDELPERPLQGFDGNVHDSGQDVGYEATADQRSCPGDGLSLRVQAGRSAARMASSSVSGTAASRIARAVEALFLASTRRAAPRRAAARRLSARTPREPRPCGAGRPVFRMSVVHQRRLLRSSGSNAQLVRLPLRDQARSPFAKRSRRPATSSERKAPTIRAGLSRDRRAPARR